MKTDYRHSWLYFTCAAFILLLALVGNFVTGPKPYLAGKSKELYEQLGQLRRLKEVQASGSFAIKSTRIVTPRGTRAGAILVREDGVIDDIVDMIAVPPNWGPILDYGRLLIMPGLIDIQNFNESIQEQVATVQDGISCLLIYISDETRDKLVRNNNSIVMENFQWSLPNDSRSVGYIFTSPESKDGFFVKKEYFEEAKWCTTHTAEHSDMSVVSLCQRIPSFMNDMHFSNLLKESVSSPFQVPRISSLQSLNNLCHSSLRSMPFFRSVCLYQIALETNFINPPLIDKNIESCMDYFWNDCDCFGWKNTNEIELLHFSKNKYRLPIAWTIAELLGISLKSFHSIACVYPANIFRLHHKGRLEKGYDADIVVWSPEMTQPFPNDICQKFEPLCQKMNKTLKGVVFETFIRGKRIL